MSISPERPVHLWWMQISLFYSCCCFVFNAIYLLRTNTVQVQADSEFLTSTWHTVLPESMHDWRADSMLSLRGHCQLNVLQTTLQFNENVSSQYKFRVELEPETTRIMHLYLSQMLIGRHTRLVLPDRYTDGVRCVRWGQAVLMAKDENQNNLLIKPKCTTNLSFMHHLTFTKNVKYSSRSLSRKP